MRKAVFWFSQADASLHPYLSTRLAQRNYLPLRPFQQLSLTLVSQSQNIFVNSCTGSGKTLAYLVPILNQPLKTGPEHHSETLIMTLNQELVGQIYA